VTLFTSEPFLCALGQSVYTILSELNLIKEEISNSEKGFRINIYRPTDYWMNVFKDYKTRSIIHVPEKLPMLVEPKKYLRINVELEKQKELYNHNDVVDTIPEKIKSFSTVTENTVAVEVTSTLSSITEDVKNVEPAPSFNDVANKINSNANVASALTYILIIGL
jgi:hypothetical protein